MPQRMPLARHHAWRAIECARLAAGLMLLASCGASMSSGASSHVTIVTDQQHYGAHDFVAATVTNGLASTILAADHQSNCSIVTIERQNGQTWQAQNPCLLKSATRLVTLAAGDATTLHLDPAAGSSASGWLPGTYRLAFTYRMGATGSETTITTSQFTIG